VAKGDYKVTLAADAGGSQALTTVVHLEAASYDVNGKPLPAALTGGGEHDCSHIYWLNCYDAISKPGKRLRD